MRNSTKFALSTLAATALFGTLGAVGTSTASADTFHDLYPAGGNGARCMVVGDDGSELFFYTVNECIAAQQDIAAEERREKRREERKDARDAQTTSSTASETE